ncbi:hypothetical protein [Sphingosinicella sp. CPCC 101087]|uniref:hypothetical protein n=1 Tax=Sphingosinicella sp. CPCC 101087 TaxID=2497754 RepID=UPI00101BB351|nr:hypothetical protein [Sphingosinicella sp. CPCC 101087]
MLNLGSIISGAFALPTRFPLAVGAWALIYALPGIASWFFVQPAMLTPLNGEGTAPFDLTRYFGSVLLVWLAMFLVVAVLMTAAFRAMLRPEEPSLVGLRLGADEIRTMGLSLLLAVAFYAGFVIVAFAIGLMFVGVGAGMNLAGSVLFIIVAIIAVLASVIWLQVRLSLVFALTFLRRRIVVVESWTLTRGRFWTLFGSYLVILLFLLMLWGVTAAVTAAPLLDSFMQADFDPEAMQAIAADRFGEFSAMTLLSWLLGGLLGALGIALYAGATSTVVRDLGVHEEDIAQTFA